MDKFSYPITPVGCYISPYNIPIKPGKVEQPIIEPYKPAVQHKTIYRPNIPGTRVYKSAIAAQRAYDRYHAKQAAQALKAKQDEQNVMNNVLTQVADYENITSLARVA